MSILDLLLETDIKKLQANNNKDYEIKRLSKILVKKFIVNCRPLTNEQTVHIGEISKNNSEIKLNAIIEACRIEGKKFNNKELMNKFNVVTPIDLLNKLLLPGEIFELYNVVNKLSGYSKDGKRNKKLLAEGDCMAHVMLDAWTKHGVRPSEIYKMSEGELKILRAFYIISNE